MSGPGWSDPYVLAREDIRFRIGDELARAERRRRERAMGCVRAQGKPGRRPPIRRTPWPMWMAARKALAGFMEGKEREARRRRNRWWRRLGRWVRRQVARGSVAHSGSGRARHQVQMARRGRGAFAQQQERARARMPGRRGDR